MDRNQNPLGKPRIDKREAEAAIERAEQAHRLYVRGKSERAIAQAMGVSKTSVHRYITAGRERFLLSIQDKQEERHAERFAGLKEILEQAWTNWESTSDLAALELARKTEADIRKLYGDDAPTKTATELSGKVDGGVAFLPPDEMLAACLAAVSKYENKKVQHV